MDIWATVKVVYYGDMKWNKILTIHNTKDEAEKEAAKIEEETGKKIYTGVIIKKED